MLKIRMKKKTTQFQAPTVSDCYRGIEVAVKTNNYYLLHYYVDTCKQRY